MRICFDLDGTLCDGERSTESGTDYSQCEPLTGARDLLKNLKAQGNTVIIHTARGMGSSHGNVQKARVKVSKLTYKQLEDWGFEYDEIYFGKPSADLYVDDKGLTALEFWEDHWEQRQWL